MVIYAIEKDDKKDACTHGLKVLERSFPLSCDLDWAEAKTK